VFSLAGGSGDVLLAGVLGVSFSLFCFGLSMF